MKLNKKLLILTTLLCLLPILAGLAVYSRLPEQVPTHFDLSGTPNGWSSRPFAVFGLPCIMAAANLLLHVVTARDPKRANVSAALKAILLWLIPMLTILCCGLTLGAALGYDVPAETLLPALVGVLFILVGNYLPKTRQNRTTGIRVKWTLESEENWDRTHRAAGFLWVVGGFIFLLLTLLHLWNGWLLTALLAVIILVPMLYSWQLHKKGI